MEIKLRLQKPYTEEERYEFIIEQNHNKGYEIKETEEELQAWGYTEEEKQEQRKQQFKQDFFNTSLGYIRRIVSMQNGSHKDFLSDLLPTIAMGVQSGLQVTVIAYDEPDFTQEEIDWEELQHVETVTPQFVQECMLQLSKDFGA